MAGVLSERKPFLLLLALLTFNLVLMSSSDRGHGRRSVLEEGLLVLSSPFLKSASWVSQGMVGLWRTYVDLRGVEEENRRLRAQVDSLGEEARRGIEARLEAGRLRETLDLKSALEYRTVTGHVIARDDPSGARVLLLDRGSNDGIAADQPIITPRGIVGRVITAAPGVAKVQTILDPNSGVAAIVQRTRAQGVVVGEGDRACRMDYVTDLASVEVGDVVITSGLDQIYPKGYIVGVVTAVGEGQGLTKLVRLKPEVDFKKLEEVLVLLKPSSPSSGEIP